MQKINRNAVLALLSLASLVFLLFQLCYYKFYLSQKNGAAFSKVRGSRSGQDSTRWHVVRKFLGLISSHNIPVYLIDPLILGLVDKDIERIRSSPDGPRPECKYFCAPRDFTTFALLDKTWKHEKNQETEMVCYYFTEELKSNVTLDLITSCFTHGCKGIKETEKKFVWQHTDMNPSPHFFVVH